MTSSGLVLGFFGDPTAADVARQNLRRAGYRRFALLSRRANGKIRVEHPQSHSGRLTAAGALSGALLGRALGRATARLIPEPAQFVLSTLAGGAVGFAVENAVYGQLPEAAYERYKASLMAGETLIVVQASGSYLADAFKVLRGGDTSPTTFLERPPVVQVQENEGPLRREPLSPERFREFATELAGSHTTVGAGGGTWLLKRLDENHRIITAVVRGLAESTRLDQPISLAAEWLLDNNYILQGQIADVQRNLSPKFLRDLPRLAEGPYAGRPRVYLIAREIVACTDSRLDRDHLIDFLANYQTVTPLTTGELWAMPLMIRLALFENLRRIAGHLDRRQRDRERADFWANRLLAAAFREPNRIIPLLGDLSREQRQLAPHFAERLVSHLFDEESALGPVRAWLEAKLDAPLAEITGREQRRQAADGVTVGNIVTSLRLLSILDWRDCFERLSLVDQILSQDPAGVYRSMDFATRDRYRQQVERISRGGGTTELDVARQAIAVAAAGIRSRVVGAAPGHDEHEHEELIYHPQGHIGYYLVDQGLGDFETKMGYRKTHWRRVRRWVRDNPTVWYPGGIIVGTVAALGGLAAIGAVAGSPVPLSLLAIGLLPASELAAQCVNYAVTRAISPKPLPKMEFKSGLPDRWRTVIVIPMLLGSVQDAIEGIHQLEIHCLSNPDPNLRFALLADYVDAPAQEMASDAERLAAAVSGVDELNRRHGERFLVFIRDRVWSVTEDRWMGWERKRGKLEEFNAFVMGRRQDSPVVLHPVAGNPDCLAGVRFVITLDADTQMPHGTAARLIETLAHPLNRPVTIGSRAPVSARVSGGLEMLDSEIVKRGYTIIQPRVDTALPSATATRFSRIFTDSSGSDPYTHVVSDVYQDAFGEGSYHGKGIYDVRVFDEVLNERFPPATLLSHDLLEGAHARVGYATDIQLLDRFPPHYAAYAKREHRWIRGDWQIMDWVGPTVPAPLGRVPNPLSPLNRWKIADNLRRSLLPPGSVAMLLAGWFSGPGGALASSVAVAGLLLWPVVSSALTRLTTRPETLAQGTGEWGQSLARSAIDGSLLLTSAASNTDAIIRVLYRRFVSGKLRLEWQTASSTYTKAAATDGGAGLRAATGFLLAAGAAAALVPQGALAVGAAAPFLVAWASAPLVVKWLAGGRGQRVAAALEDDDELWLRGIARQTWRYYDDFVGPQTNWLPPDNYQEALNVEIAQRTSPTNMGLWLLACVAANDFGWLPFDEVVGRTEATLATLDELEKYEGHLLNWYNSLTLQPLLPRYVSTVDSGNLLGALWTLAVGMEELSRKPLFGNQVLSGLRDVLGLLSDSLGQDKSAFEANLSQIEDLLKAAPASAGELSRVLRLLELPIGELSRSLSLRPLPRRTSARARAELQLATTDPRFVIAAPSYWAAQLESQLDLWLQIIARYGRWMDMLTGWPEVGLVEFAPEARELRLKALEHAPSLAGLARGEAPGMPELLELRNRPGIPVKARAWLDSLANEFGRARWLAGEMVSKSSAVADAARRLADGMGTGFLYDPGRRLFSIGYNVEERRLDGSFYDLLASECRLLSFCAVARGDVPVEHWIALGRRFGDTPAGPILMSWSGTMFEYLMPLIFQRPYENSLLDHAEKTAVAAQIHYGNSRGVPWGISEAAFSAIDAHRIYQYKAFGVPSLGLKRGLEDDLVVAPYATLMALMVDRTSALENLRRLEDMGARGEYGFYESVDFTRERLEEDSIVRAGEGETAPRGGRRAGEAGKGNIVRCYMVHHQGMALLSLQNVLCDWVVQHRFHADPVVESAEPLLYEKIPDSPPILEMATNEDARPTRVELGGAPPERTQSPDSMVPRAHLLGSQSYSVMVTAAGSGYSRWRDFEITRWRGDTTRDNWGQFLYIRDRESGLAWSATHQPMRHTPRRANVWFRAEKVEYERLEAEIESRLEICVSPEEDVEVRRLTVVNHSTREREIDVTSFMELSLAPHNADRSHPAFNKLFIQTAYWPEREALLAWRRKRSPGDPPIWAAHFVTADEPDTVVQYETDRARFLGRMRNAANPASLETDLSGTTGAVLDPCFAVRRRFKLRPGQRLQFALVTCAAESEERIRQLVEVYRDFSQCERVFDLAWTHSQLELHHLRLLPDEVQSFQQLVGYLMYPHQAMRAPARRLRENLKGQPGLWAYGISGDLPIMITAIEDERDVAAVRQALMAQTFWRTRGFKCDLVILNEEAGGYNQALSETLSRLVESSTPYTGINQPGGVFPRSTDNIPREDMTLLNAAARVILIAARGSISQHLGLINEDTDPAPRFTPVLKEAHNPDLPLPFLELPYFNGLGGFSQDGREYDIYLGANDRTPAPWINVFAHENFGAVVSEAGQGYAWQGNSQSNRITPWSNDPVGDTPVEGIYIRDEDTGVYWTPTPLPVREPEAYRARHGQGYSVFEHNSHGIEQLLTVFVPLGEKPLPVRVQQLKLRNRSNRKRRFQVTFFAEFVLGTTREENQMHVVTSWDTESGSLLARNAYNPDFAGQFAFVSATPAPSVHSGDRASFLGRNGTFAAPAAMRRKQVSERTGAGFDPCAVLQVAVEVDPGQEVTVSFLLGQASSVEEVRTIVNGFRQPGSVESALDVTRQWWDGLLGTLQVDVPDMAVNFLVNRWLPYQTLSCRIWGRSALYQSGGAWGFRDQLQDSLALLTLYPKACREQILRSAAHQFEEGDVLHWWHPPGDAGVRTLITDDLLFLPFAVAQYVSVTGDAAILDEMVPFLAGAPLGPDEHERYFKPEHSATTATLFEHCRRAIEKGATRSEQGLPLIGGGDWNDGFNRVGIEGRGESVWLAWFLVDVLNRFAAVCRQRGETDLAGGYEAKAKEYLTAIDAHAWDGEWYRRGSFDDGTPLGSAESTECRIDSLPQSWSVIAGGGDPERSRQAMASLEKYLVKQNEAMVLLFTPAFDQSPHDPGYIKGYLPGVRENGGQYTHAACWVAYAYALAGDGERAVKTLRMLNPVEHARTPEAVELYKVEPYAVAADVYALENQLGRGGWTWYTGSCGWMYRVWVEGVLGFRKHGETLFIAPAIPPDWKGFNLVYRHGGATYRIRVENPNGVMSGVVQVTVDGSVLPDGVIPLRDDGREHAVVVTMGVVPVAKKPKSKSRARQNPETPPQIEAANGHLNGGHMEGNGLAPATSPSVEK